MKLAFTSDLHLKRRDETPGRFKAFEDIIHSLKKENISELIIAGDLFNKEDAGMADFELLCASNPSINFHIIPGNHDSLL
ncbi:MAG: metallophosphoesterase, partial [Elusimicrobiota bacterium]